MKGIHPNLGLVALTALAVVSVCAVGCGHNQTGITNPFLAPDRVSPPSTRVVAPGTAQPYYPGDPLPVMQSAAPVAAEALNVAAAAPSVPTEPKQFAASNESSIGVPSDDNSLRFELPPPPEPAPTPTTPLADARSTQATPVAAQSTPAPGVVPAIYNTAPTNGLSDDAIAPAATVASGPWRSPSIPASTPPAGYSAVPQPYVAPPGVSPGMAQPAVMPGYVYVPPMSAAPPSVNVSLRAVQSPSPEPLESSTPRIRIPGYPAPPVTVTPQLPTASDVSSDGFRPRGSMR
ncbi:MAG: hypothetical protein WD468_05870 [Pirellulales bacterium]